MSSQGAKCPQFENPDPVLIPVGYKTRISFEGINLDKHQVQRRKRPCRDDLLVLFLIFNSFFLSLSLQGRAFTVGTELMRNEEEDVNFEDGPFYTFSGFNVSQMLISLCHMDSECVQHTRM